MYIYIARAANIYIYNIQIFIWYVYYKYVFNCLYIHNPLGNDQYEGRQMRPTWGSLNPVKWRTHGPVFMGPKSELLEMNHHHLSCIMSHHDKSKIIIFIIFVYTYVYICYIYVIYIMLIMFMNFSIFSLCIIILITFIFFHHPLGHQTLGRMEDRVLGEGANR